MTKVVDWDLKPQIKQTNRTVQGYGEKCAGNKVTKTIILINYMSRLIIKPTKWHVCPAMIPISLVFAFRMKKAWVLSYQLSAQRKLWSDWSDAQADMSLRWAHSRFAGFVIRRLISNIMQLTYMSMYIHVHAYYCQCGSTLHACYGDINDIQICLSTQITWRFAMLLRVVTRYFSECFREASSAQVREIASDE